ncbi:hypothetical protein [Pandoraea soli]
MAVRIALPLDLLTRYPSVPKKSRQRVSVWRDFFMRERTIGGHARRNLRGGTSVMTLNE